MLECTAQKFDAGMSARAHAQHPRQEGRPVEALAVPANGDFVPGAAGEVRPGVRVQPLLGKALIVGEADERLCGLA
ncbi:MAG: hypothetical protein WC684_03930 [Hyphomicrobium sp.]|jgi:hypothetical protein